MIIFCVEIVFLLHNTFQHILQNQQIQNNTIGIFNIFWIHFVGFAHL